jgi:multimeric flavodoxin WrbA
LNTRLRAVIEPPLPFVLGVGGSPREGGNSDLLLREMLTGVVEQGVDAEAVHLRELSFQGCIGCEKCRKTGVCTGLKDELAPVYGRLLAAQGLILVSPTHNYNVTAWMKAFIDRLYCYYEFDDCRPRGWSSRLAGQRRKAVIGAICEQSETSDLGFTLEAMRRPLEALGYELVGELTVLGVFDAGAVGEKREVMTKARDLAGDLARSLSA